MKHSVTPVRPTAEHLAPLSVGYENLLGEKYIIESYSSSSKINPDLEELIETLAYTRPKWLFVGCKCLRHRGFYSFNVFEGEEYLGSIGIDSHSSDVKYVVDNPRIDKKKERTLRTHSLTTRDLKKAKNAINKNFGVKNVEEQLAELDTQARAGLGSLRSSRYSNYKFALNRLVQLITPAIEKQPELFAAMCPEIDSEVLEDFEEHKHKADTTKSVNDALRNNLGMFIITRGGEYLIKNLADEQNPTKTLTSEAVPFEIKRKLGMLKLLPTGATLQGVGYKIGDTTFFIAGDWSEPQELV